MRSVTADLFRVNPKNGEEELRDVVSLLQMRVSGCDYGLNADCLIFLKAICNRLGVTDECRASTRAYEAQPRPKIGRNC
jgi:hypothetical protein